MIDALINPLATLADQMLEDGLRLYRRVELGKWQTVVDAAKCGAHFSQIKAALPHGEFGAWLEANCPEIKERQIQDYMRLAREMPELLDDSNTRYGAVLSIKSALAYIAAPEEVKAEVDAKLEAGESVTQKEISELKRHSEEAKLRAEAAERQAEAEAKEAEELSAMLADAEHALIETRRQMDALVEQRTAANTAEVTRKLKELEDLNAAIKEQRDRMLADNHKRIETLEKGLTREREAKAKAIEDARKQGADSVLQADSEEAAELERRIKMREDRIEQLRAEEARLTKKISLTLQSDKALKAGKQAMLAFSVEMMEFQERLHENPEQATDDMGSAWHKAADEMEAGARAVREIARAITTQPALKLTENEDHP